MVGDDEVTEGESITLNITAVSLFVSFFMVKKYRLIRVSAPRLYVVSLFLITSLPTSLQRTRSCMISPTFVNFTSSTTQVSVTIGGVLDEVPELAEMVTISFIAASANVQDFDYNVTVVDATGEGPTVLCVCMYIPSVDMCTVRLFASNYIL